MPKNSRLLQHLQFTENESSRLFRTQAKLMRFCFLIIILFTLTGATTFETHPLAPPNTDSPRSTLKSFIKAVSNGYQLYISGDYDSKELKFYGRQARRCLDLSKLPPSLAFEVGVQSLLLLKEVLDRIEIPPYEEIPDRAAMKEKRFQKWVLPNSDITISMVEEGPHQGEYLFSAETIAQLKNFYQQVEHLPYKPGASVGFYEDYIMGSGWMIPGALIHKLPPFFKNILYEQAVWQWLGLLLVMILGAAVILLVFHFSRRKYAPKTDEPLIKRFLRKTMLPFAIVLVCFLVEYLLNDQINITGSIMTIIIFILEIFLFVAMAWIISLTGNTIAEWFIAQPSIHSDSIDANMIRIISRVTTIIILFFLMLKATSDLGVSLTAVFASAGIAGLALALAARETIANFFGGINILIDRPFRVGDYIIIDSGERGEVVDVGLRSTRINTRDDVQISIPNSRITDAKIINESVPKNRFRVRIKIGVAYGSDVDQVEEILLEIAKTNVLITLLPEPRVRFRSFGDSALEFELLCWAYKPDVKGKLVHELNRDIYKAFDKAGISIPFPQRDMHLITENKGADEKKALQEKQAGQPALDIIPEEPKKIRI
jgi:MscS family membrane protein